MLDEKKISELVTTIRNAYREYPKSDSTVDAMISQALRTGYVRGTKTPDRAERRDELSNQLPAITPKTHGMDWEDLAEWLHFEKKAAAKRAAREVLFRHAVKEPALDPRYWLLFHAAELGFEARDEL